MVIAYCEIMFKKIFTVLTLSLFILPSSVFAIPHASSLLRNIVDHEPSFQRMCDFYLRREGLTMAHYSQWESRIHKAAYFPTLYLGYDHQLRFAQSITVNDNVSIASGIVTVGPEDSNTDFDNNIGKTFHARAVWDLSDVVFNHELFSLSKDKRDMTSMRSSFSESLHKIYDQRIQTLAYYLSLKNKSPDKASIYYAKYLSLTQRLDEMTDREFTDSFWKEK
jgi:hypothetical protein